MINCFLFIELIQFIYFAIIGIGKQGSAVADIF